MKKTLKIFLFLLCFCANAIAQGLLEFSVAGFEEKPFDISARDERYKVVDGNGTLFSIIKLVSTTPNDDLRAYSFDFGLCESRVKEVGDEVWLYVQRNAMRVTICREGYKTVKYELNTTVQPGKVYEMVLSAQARKVQKQMVLFKVIPANSNATVMYAVNSPNAKEDMLGMLNEYGQLSKNLPLGSYTYRIVSTDYKPSSGLLVLNDIYNTYVEEVELRPKFSTITFSAEPGVQVLVDGESVGYGTCSINLNAGEYNVECRKEFYKSAFMVVNVEEGRNDSIFIKPLTPIIGSLSVITEPSGAEIIIDGDNYGTTPKNVNELLIGRHSLALLLDGYKSIERTIYIKGGKTEEVDVVLDKIPVKGTLRIDSSPQGASVTLNGELQSLKTPCVIDGLSPGKYDVKVEKSGYKNETVTVAVLEDEETECSVELQFISNRQGDKSSGKTSILVGEHVGHEYVDLGLSVKWATCNVGASKPEEYGGYYAWGETEEKSNYSWSTYKWCENSYYTMTKYCTSSSYGTVDNKTVLDPEDDVAHVKWGGTWRMPTLDEQKELLNNCIWTWTTQNEVTGYKVTGPNGNSIFLPAAGIRGGTEVHRRVSGGYFWSSSLRIYGCYNAYYLYFNSGNFGWSYYDRCYGLSVRPVSE